MIDEKKFEKVSLQEKLFTEICKIELPINPIITRWGTWLEASFYYCENFSRILEFIKKLSHKKNKTIEKLKKLVEDLEVHVQIKNSIRFKFLTESIENVIDRNLSSLEQFDIIEKLEQKLTGEYSIKLRKSLEKNSNLRNFIQNIKNNFEFDQTFLYCPITTIDVERSFAKFKFLLTDQRKRLNESNIEKFSFVYVNNFF